MVVNVNCSLCNGPTSNQAEEKESFDEAAIKTKKNLKIFISCF